MAGLGDYVAVLNVTVVFSFCAPSRFFVLIAAHRSTNLLLVLMLLFYDIFDGLFCVCVCRRYRPGQGIAPHVDTHAAFGPEIASVSMGTAAVVRFTRAVANGGGSVAETAEAKPTGVATTAADGAEAASSHAPVSVAVSVDATKAGASQDASDGTASATATASAATVTDTTASATATSDSDTRPVVLQPRSLMVMGGESRYAWAHGIAAAHVDFIDPPGTDGDRRVGGRDSRH